MNLKVPDELTFFLRRREDGNFDLHYSESYDLEKRGMTKGEWKSGSETTMTFCAILLGLRHKGAQFWRRKNTLHARLENLDREELVRMMTGEIMAEEKS